MDRNKNPDYKNKKTKSSKDFIGKADTLLNPPANNTNAPKAKSKKVVKA